MAANNAYYPITTDPATLALEDAIASLDIAINEQHRLLLDYAYHGIVPLAHDEPATARMRRKLSRNGRGRSAYDQAYANYERMIKSRAKLARLQARLVADLEDGS